MDQQADKQQHVPALNVPGIILAIALVFLAVHLYRLTLGQSDAVRFLLRFAFIPARFGDSAGFPIGGFPGGAVGDAWTFFTYALIHADWTHLTMNGLWMLVFGSVAARRLGATRFVALSLVCAAAGAATMLAVYWGELVPVIGASAAVSGHMAAAFRLMYGGGNLVFPASALAVARDPRALTFFGVWVAINLIFGFGAVSITGEDANIAWQAHIGGFVCGFFLFGPIDRIGRSGFSRIS